MNEMDERAKMLEGRTVLKVRDLVTRDDMIVLELDDGSIALIQCKGSDDAWLSVEVSPRVRISPDSLAM